MFNFLLILAVGYIDREDDPGQNWALVKQPANNGSVASDRKKQSQPLPQVNSPRPPLQRAATAPRRSKAPR